MRLTKSNYFSPEANREYMSVSQFKQFLDCPAAALAEIRGEWERPTSTALLEGSYIDAYFSGDLIRFQSEHPEILNKRTGELKAEYKKAAAAIRLVEQDKGFMEYLSGEPQNILTGELAGIPWKAKPDFTFMDKLVDLKYMRDMQPIWKQGERKTFIEAWGYHIQGYVYQQLELQRTGLLKPFYLAVITKEEPADHAIIGAPQWLLNSVAGIVEHYAPLFTAYKTGSTEAPRCGACAYCRSTKKIEKITSYEALLDAI